MVTPSFCVIKLYYLGNYHGMAVNYHGIKLFYNIGQKKSLLSVSHTSLLSALKDQNDTALLQMLFFVFNFFSFINKCSIFYNENALIHHFTY